MSKPYIGITGIVSVEEARAVGRMVQEVTSGNASHELMCGVLVSGKTLAGELVPNRRYPLLYNVQSITEELSRFSFTTLHYNTQQRAPLAEQLTTLFSVAGPAHGVQLNIRRPDPDQISQFKEKHADKQIILQVNGSSLSNRTPEAVGEYVSRYYGLVEHALLDLSGGNSKELDVEWVAQCLNQFGDEWNSYGIRGGVAGGLGPDCGPILEILKKKVTHLFSIDAEGKPRIPVIDPLEGERYQDVLSMDLLFKYLKISFATLKATEITI